VSRPLEGALERLASTETLLVALDFDGTLAPFVQNPADARALPEATDAIARLLRLAGTRVAYVSGRALDSLERVTGAPPSVLLVGSHGAEYRLGDAESHPPLTDEDRRRVERMTASLRAIASRYPGVRVEEKPAGAVIHTRAADRQMALSAEDQARRDIASKDPQAVIRDGKDVVEFSVLPATKADGIRRLRARTGATAVLYAGDDVTDEDAFAALETGDVGIKVGDGATVAAYRVSDPREVAAMLHRLATLRAGSTAAAHV